MDNDPLYLANFYNSSQFPVPLRTPSPVSPLPYRGTNSLAQEEQQQQPQEQLDHLPLIAPDHTLRSDLPPSLLFEQSVSTSNFGIPSPPLHANLGHPGPVNGSWRGNTHGSASSSSPSSYAQSNSSRSNMQPPSFSGQFQGSKFVNLLHMNQEFERSNAWPLSFQSLPRPLDAPGTLNLHSSSSSSSSRFCSSSSSSSPQRISLFSNTGSVSSSSSQHSGRPKTKRRRQSGIEEPHVPESTPTSLPMAMNVSDGASPMLQSPRALMGRRRIDLTCFAQHRQYQWHTPRDQSKQQSNGHSYTAKIDHRSVLELTYQTEGPLTASTEPKTFPCNCTLKTSIAVVEESEAMKEVANKRIASSDIARVFGVHLEVLVGAASNQLSITCLRTQHAAVIKSRMDRTFQLADTEDHQTHEVDLQGVVWVVANPQDAGHAGRLRFTDDKTTKPEEKEEKEKHLDVLLMFRPTLWQLMSKMKRVAHTVTVTFKLEAKLQNEPVDIDTEWKVIYTYTRG